MKNTLKLTFALFLTLTIISCSNDEINKEETYLYKSEKVNFSDLVNNKTSNKSKSLEKSDDFIYSEFETTFFIPENLNDIELSKYISENQSSIDGSIKYLINDNEFISFKITKGEIEIITKNNDIQFNKNYPCSYNGIQDCVQYIVYNDWTTLNALICAATGGLLA